MTEKRGMISSTTFFWRTKNESTPVHLLLSPAAFGIFLTVSLQSAFAQSQASNGQIEGYVIDQNGSAVPGTLVTVISVETGATRSVLTDERGTFWFPLMPLETPIDSRLVLFKLCIGEECFSDIARKFLSWYPDSIRFGSHLSSLATKAAPCKVIAKQENMIPMRSNERSGDPFHLHDAILHSSFLNANCHLKRVFSPQMAVRI